MSGVRIRTCMQSEPRDNSSFIIFPLFNTLIMPDFQDQFTQATELVELCRLDEALALFQKLLKTDSNNATLWNNIGIIQFRQGKYRDAVNAFGQATDTDPKFTNAWFNKSLAIVNLGKDTEALRALIKSSS